MNIISEHISYEEATHSNTANIKGITNDPDNVVIQRMNLVARMVFEPLRAHFGVPLGINSFYRSPELNKAIGGATNSQHCTGEAIDIDSSHSEVTNKMLFDYIHKNMVYDQLIWEMSDANGQPQWVHVSYSGKVNRKQALMASKINGSTIYSPFK